MVTGMPPEGIQSIHKYPVNPIQLKPSQIAKYHFFAKLMAGVTGAVAFVVLLGWLLGLPSLTHIFPIWPPLKVGTALCFLVLAVSLFIQTNVSSRKNIWLIRQCLGFVVLLSGITLLYYFLKAFSWGNFELQLEIFLDEMETLTSPLAAFGFLLSGGSLLCSIEGSSSKSIAFSQSLASSVILLGLLMFNGYIFVFDGHHFDFQQLREIILISTASFQAAVLFILLGLGILAMQAEQGFMHLFSSDTPAGLLLRRLLPGIVVTVLGIEWLAFIGHNIGWYSDLLGDVVATCLIIAIVGIVLVRAAKQLSEQAKIRKESEKALFESEKRFSATFYQAAVGIAHVALDGSFLKINQKFCDIVGYPQDELLGLTFQDITFSDDLDPNVGHLQKFLDGKITNYSTEKRYIRKDGSLVWANLTVSLVHDMQEQPDYFISLIKNISIQKQAEEQVLQLNKELEDRVAQRTEELIRINANLEDTVKRFEQVTLELQQKNTIMENALEGIAKLSSQGFFISINGAYSKITGYEQDELIGRHWECIVVPDEIPNIKQAYQKTSLTGKMEIQTRGIRKDGSIFYKEIVLTTCYDKQGKIEGYYYFLKDITERVLLEEEKEKERKIFVSTLTHDLRTPLIAQRRVLDLLKEEFGTLDEEPTRLTDALIRNNENLLVMVNHLLESYQYQDGKIKLNYNPANLRELANECIAEMAIISLSHSIQLINNIPESLPLVHVDPQQIKRVFQNLLGNALANMPPGDRIELYAYEHENFLQVQVSDNGPGIDPDIRPFLFERYFMGSKKQKIGSGLGLFICRLILQQHGGSIDVQSNPTTGTMFIFTLPTSPKVLSNV